MTHHHTLPGPTRGDGPRPYIIEIQPDGSTVWRTRSTPSIVVGVQPAKRARRKRRFTPKPTPLRLIYANRPTSAGMWLYTSPPADIDDWWSGKNLYDDTPVLVTETPGAGRLCRELRMGGSAQCGFADWSGEWRKP